MTALILAEHDNTRLSDATARTLSAALQIDTDVHILVAGKDCAAVARGAAALAGVAKVLVCDDPLYANALAEPVSELLLSLAGGYGAILAPATANGKNILPRVAARLDLPQISDVIAVETPEIFVRPIYAGNAIQKVAAIGFTKIITV